MKIKFFTVLSMYSMFIGVDFSAFAACYSSEAGEYCLTSKKYTCPAGCYCQKAPGDYGALDRKGNGQRDIYQEDVAAWCKNGTACKWSAGSGQCGTSNDAKIFRCPSGFTSDAGKASIEECYASCGGTKLPYKKIHCEKGYFLHYKTKECYKCEGRNSDPSLSAKAICIGGDFYPTCGTNNQGTQLCEDPMVPNKERTECVLKTVTCGSNEIYNADKTACTKCAVGTTPNSSQTECVEASAQTVQPGYYLPKGSGSKPQQCSGATYYCPGGEFTESDTDQGKFKCPSGSTANPRKTACTLKIPKDNLKFGPDKNMPEDYQCWMYIGDASKYKSCVLSKLYYK